MPRHAVGFASGCLFDNQLCGSQRLGASAACTLQVLDACLSSGALRSLSLPTLDSPPESPLRSQASLELQAEEVSTAGTSAASHFCSGFGGPAFWAALREVEGLEQDVRELLAEARQVLRRRGALSLVVRGAARETPLHMQTREPAGRR